MLKNIALFIVGFLGSSAVAHAQVPDPRAVASCAQSLVPIGWEPYLASVAAVVAAAKVFVASTPTPQAGSPWYWPYRIVNYAALVFGKMGK